MKKKLFKAGPGNFPWSFAYAAVALAIVMALLLCVHELVLISGRRVGFTTLRFSSVVVPDSKVGIADARVDNDTTTLVIAAERVYLGAAKDIFTPSRPRSIRSLPRSEFDALLSKPENLRMKLAGSDSPKVGNAFALAIGEDAMRTMSVSRLASIRRAMGSTSVPAPWAIIVSIPGL